MIGAGKGVADTCCGIVLTAVLVVVGLEVGCRQGDVVLNLIAEAQTNAVAVNNELHVVHVFVRESIAGQLSTA